MVKTEPQNDDILPRKAVGAKRLNSTARLVDYGTDDEDTVEGPSPLRAAPSSIEVPRNQEATTEQARESQITTIVNGSVAKKKSPTSNGPKVCAL